MKYFLQMFEHAKAGNVAVSPSGSLSREALISSINSALLNAESFVFAPTGTTKNVEDEIKHLSKEEKIDLISALPFESCFFEIFNDYVSRNNSPGHQFDLKGILIHDYQKEFRFYLLVEMDGRTLIYPVDKYFEALSTFTFDLVVALLIRFRREKVGRESVRVKTKCGRGKNKTTRTIRRVLHVCPPSSIRKIYENKNKREIDWKQRWITMAHWRYFYKKLKDGSEVVDHNRVGKNRNNEYVESGRTWVTEHEKGPEDKPIVKKTRFVK